MKKLWMFFLIIYSCMGMTSAAAADIFLEKSGFETGNFSVSVPWQDVQVETWAMEKHLSIFIDANSSEDTFNFFEISGFHRDRIDSLLELDNSTAAATIVPVPELAKLLLFGIGLIGCSVFGKKFVR